MRDLQMFDPQTVRSLQWTLATIGVEEFGIHFESVGEPELGVVNDSNKSKFVRSKIDQILVKSRHAHLLAIKTGFSEALRSLSEEAAPFLSLLSHTDWRVMLCGDTAISGPQVNAALKYSGFPKKSLVPIWLKEIIISFSEDHLRKFLVFVTGCPSLASTSSFGRVEINVRYQVIITHAHPSRLYILITAYWWHPFGYSFHPNPLTQPPDRLVVARYQ